MVEDRPLVLVVDDNEAGRYTKMRTLRRMDGVALIEAASGNEALRLVAEQHPTLVLLDVKLPDISGLEVCSAIKRDHPDTLVLQTSASFVTGMDRTRGLEAGADAYLVQPAEPNEIVANVRALLRIRNAEQRLRESERELRFTLKAGRFGAWTLDLATGELTTSEVCRTNFGRDPDAPFTYEQLRAAVYPEDQARMAAAVEHTIASGADYDIEYRIVTPAGEVRWVLIRAQLSCGPDGSPLKMAGVSIDITDRKRTEAHIRELNETLERQVVERTVELRRFRDIVEATTSPICAFDNDFRLIAFNQAHNDAFRRVNGFDTKLGDIFPDLFIPEQQPVMRALMARALSGEQFTVTEEFGRPELGQPLWEINYTPLRDESGAVIGAFHLANDISDRLRAEADLAAAQEALRQSQKMEAMGSLTGGVAHDFNNLLTPIVGTLDMLQRRGIGGEREQRLIAGAAQSADRAKVLVQRLLAFARRQPLQPVAVDVAQLVGGMGDLVASTTGPQIKVVVDAPDGLPPAKADPNQLEMALLNLSVNARDAMPDGGTLRISAAAETVRAETNADLRPGRYVRVSVADTGTGMDETTLARAVEPFFSTKGVGKGTGLGLSMVHGLASQLGGALRIKSKPGLGTNIELWLPQTEDAFEEPAVRGEAGAAKQHGTALLVDDEKFVRLSTADMLTDLGYRVLEAESAEEALRLFEDAPQIDVVITDHLMPGMTGTDLARSIRDRQPNLPVLIVSGYAEVDDIAPDLPRLTKPFRKDELVARLATLSSSKDA